MTTATRRTTRSRRWRPPVAALLAIGILLTGCSSADDAPDAVAPTTSGGDVDAPAVADDFVESEWADDMADSDAEVAEDSDGAVRTTASGAPTGQKVIRTAELVLESSDTGELLTRVRAVADRAGGYTATSDLERDDEGTVRGTVTLRVPTEELSSVVDELEELGDAVPVNRIDEQDVTTEHADLQARIDNLTAYERELTTLMADIRESTDRPEDLLSIFERIRSVREDIDVLEGRLASLSDQVAYATVTVTLRPVDDDSPFSEEEGGWTPGETFQEALAATGRLLASLGDGLIWLVVTGVPVLVSFLGIPALLVLLAIRWYRRRPQTPATATSYPEGPRGGSGGTPPPPSSSPLDPPGAGSSPSGGEPNPA